MNAHFINNLLSPMKVHIFNFVDLLIDYKEIPENRCSVNQVKPQQIQCNVT